MNDWIEEYAPVDPAILCVLGGLTVDVLSFAGSSLRSQTALIAENLFLRKQLAVYQERQIRPRRLSNAARLWLVFRSHFLCLETRSSCCPACNTDWLASQGISVVLKWKSRPGRPPIPLELRRLIVEMVRENPTWREERIAHELWLKLGIRVSPRTVRAYWPTENPWSSLRSQGWHTFVRNHARALLACDFMVMVTARFQYLYVFVVMAISCRRIPHCNVTPHPTKRNRKVQREYDKDLYKQRNRIERRFGKLKCLRRFATRHEKSKACFKAPSRSHVRGFASNYMSIRPRHFNDCFGRTSP